jgi:hypothetical protein
VTSTSQRRSISFNTLRLDALAHSSLRRRYALPGRPGQTSTLLKVRISLPFPCTYYALNRDHNTGTELSEPLTTGKWRALGAQGSGLRAHVTTTASHSPRTEHLLTPPISLATVAIRSTHTSWRRSQSRIRDSLVRGKLCNIPGISCHLTLRCRSRPFDPQSVNVRITGLVAFPWMP